MKRTKLRSSNPAIKVSIILLLQTLPKDIWTILEATRSSSPDTQLDITVLTDITSDESSDFAEKANWYSRPGFTVCTISQTESMRVMHTQRSNAQSGQVDSMLVVKDSYTALPEILSTLLAAAKDTDVVATSLYYNTDGYGYRRTLSARSRAELLLVKILFPISLGSHIDPLATAFLVSKNVLMNTSAHTLSAFTLPSIVTSNNGIRVKEIPTLINHSSKSPIARRSNFRSLPLLRVSTAVHSIQNIFKNERLNSLNKHHPTKPAAVTVNQQASATEKSGVNKFLLLNLALVLTYSTYRDVQATIITLLTLSGVVLFFQASIEAIRMLYAFRDPEAIDALSFPQATRRKEKERFCIIVPARHESEVIGGTLQQLAQQTYKNTTIIAVICDDDHETLDAAQTAASGSSRIEVIEYPLAANVKPSKPKQLNHVYAQTKKDGYTIYGIIDAEDTVHPDLVLRIAAAFNTGSPDVVQGGVQLMNHDTSWYSLHNVLEYYRWFNSGMAFHSNMGFMPLGGNTIFIKSTLIEAAGGWPDTLTEDCSLGVLLSTKFQAKTAVYYEPELATREETPDTIKGLFMQRVRWNQGFYQEWKKGVWKNLPTRRQRLLADYVLISPILMAGISIMLFVSVISALTIDAPVGIVMIMYMSLIPGVLMVVINGLFLHDFGKAFNKKITIKQYASLFLTQFFYQAVLNAAALWSVVREIRGDRSWYKTPHKGLHRQTETKQIEYQTVQRAQL